MIALIETFGGRPTKLAEIENNCEKLARARSRLEKKKDVIEREQRAVLDVHRAELRELSEDVARARLELEKQVHAARELFQRPKMQKFHGIVVGFEKERDKLMTPDDETLIPRIEKLLRAKAGTVIATTKRIVRDALKQLPKGELQSLGCEFVSGADKVVVRPEGVGDVEKEAEAYLVEARHKIVT